MFIFLLSAFLYLHFYSHLEVMLGCQNDNFFSVDDRFNTSILQNWATFSAIIYPTEDFLFHNFFMFYFPFIRLRCTGVRASRKSVPGTGCWFSFKCWRCYSEENFRSVWNASKCPQCRREGIDFSNWQVIFISFSPLLIFFMQKFIKDKKLSHVMSCHVMSSLIFFAVCYLWCQSCL